MKKSQAIQQLGGTASIAARKLGMTRQAVSQWPKVLTPRILERIEPVLLEEAKKREALKS